MFSFFVFSSYYYTIVLNQSWLNCGLPSWTAERRSLWDFWGHPSSGYLIRDFENFVVASTSTPFGSWELQKEFFTFRLTISWNFCSNSRLTRTTPTAIYITRFRFAFFFCAESLSAKSTGVLKLRCIFLIKSLVIIRRTPMPNSMFLIYITHHRLKFFKIKYRYLFTLF